MENINEIYTENGQYNQKYVCYKRTRTFNGKGISSTSGVGFFERYPRILFEITATDDKTFMEAVGVAWVRIRDLEYRGKISAYIPGVDQQCTALEEMRLRKNRDMLSLSYDVADHYSVTCLLI